MKKIVFKVGGNLSDDLKAFAGNKKKPVGGTTTVYLKNLKDLHEMLTPQRLALLDEMINSGLSNQKNVSEIAKKMRRKQEAVSRDLGILEKKGLVRKTKHKQHVFPKIAFSKIQIEFSKATA